MKELSKQRIAKLAKLSGNRRTLTKQNKIKKSFDWVGVSPMTLPGLIILYVQ